MKTVKKISTLMSARARDVYLTFDVEDFVNDKSIYALYIILELLKKYNLKGLFFITGHMIEKICFFPEILDLLNAHVIGYHSSSHSVRPNIFEYTDVKNYEEAYLESYKREISHINPLTGEIEERGGIELLRDVFAKKKIEAYRAPGLCWSPPHLEALKKLGIKYDFSTNISSIHVCYKGITFYPRPIISDWRGNFMSHRILLSSLMKKEVIVINLHPNFLLNRNGWDSIYWKSNPKKLFKTRSRNWEESKRLFIKLELLLKKIKLLQTLNLIEVTPDLKKSYVNLNLSNLNIQKIYETCISWPTLFFNYKPTYLRYHFFKFFDIEAEDTCD